MRYTLVDHNNHEVALERCDEVKHLGVRWKVVIYSAWNN